MQALDILYEEHQHILRVLDAAEHAVAQAREGRVDAEFFVALAEFIGTYADGAHHAKEEQLLFRALEDFGHTDHLSCMLREHSYGRELRAWLDGAAAALAARADGALLDVLDATERYAFLLRSHIRKEDQGLFPNAAHAIPAEAFQTLLERYPSVTSVTPADFAAASDRLASWFGPAMPPKHHPRFPTGSPRVLGR